MPLPTTVAEVNALILDKYKLSTSMPQAFRDNVGKEALALFDYFHEQMLISNFRELRWITSIDNMTITQVKVLLHEYALPYLDNLSGTILRSLLVNAPFIVRFRNAAKGFIKYLSIIIADPTATITISNPGAFKRIFSFGVAGHVFPSYAMITEASDNDFLPRLYSDDLVDRDIFVVVQGTVSAAMKQFIIDIAPKFVPMSNSSSVTLTIKFVEL